MPTPQNREFDRGTPVLNVNASTFAQEVLKSPEPVLVEFRADWCSQCVTLQPVFESMADEKLGAVKFAIVDIERNESLAGEYHVRGVPTLLLFLNGVIEETIVGMTTELDLRQLLDRFS